jgi:hypothetical protein
MADVWHYVRVVGSAVPFCGEKNPQHSTTQWLYVTCTACRIAALREADAVPARRARPARSPYRK